MKMGKKHRNVEIEEPITHQVREFNKFYQIPNPLKQRLEEYFQVRTVTNSASLDFSPDVRNHFRQRERHDHAAVRRHHEIPLSNAQH